ncbi:hypothetical protein MDOR_11510 [Mycolicibacterium doricum]|uniref:Iron-containing redox enzyme family protein n=1 Tax=Mycolicibacterium doricum TaxID=126673 RepID=A0A1X1TDQ1_9MYCO|nr:iron-containing redox enzyme family protein [Mycolicibacterium doricum]MCV7266860.1 iron-containing redox enzyme family protein [Mycolicibacterium doricum]ORV42618.1 hypothetical protein AWC01_07785 [Mycolicibacterium doricum]BBZ06982.1 hypothetical protein MDOR_11510 [Mycolicibacterium doricum]
MPTTNELLKRYADNQLFRDSDTWEMTRPPYQRSLRHQALGAVDVESPLSADDFMNYEALAAQRILTTVYEQDLVFLPRDRYDGWKEDFDEFYSQELRDLANQFRGTLEQFLYGHLERDVAVSDGWTKERFCEFLSDRDKEPEGAMDWNQTIRSSRDPQRAARMWLVQLAPDFLSESSPMIKNVLGNFGPVQSEWFKIVIDEYGYGVHDKKHSTLYEKTLESVGLDSRPHYYWQYYLSSALSANNFFHYMGSEHRNFFRYVGALALTESSLVHFCEQAAEVLASVFPEQCDVEYFTEHCHIDDHHGRMALEDVCLPLVDKFGEAIIPEMVWGMLAYEHLMSQFDTQFRIQIEWMDAQPEMFDLHKKIAQRILSASNVPVADLDEPFNDLSNSHCHNQDELCHIISGTMYFFSGLDSKLILGPGDGVVIKNRRQHGADILSDSCQYQIHSIGDVDRWL